MRKRNGLLLSFFIVSSINATGIDNPQTIPPVIIKKPVAASTTSGPKTIITKEQMHSSGVTTLAQALQNLGGVQLQDLSGNNSQVLLGLRGFGANASSNTLLLLNGIPVTNPDLAPPDLNAIPLNEIQAIEIMAGSESVLYGDQAVGGVINILTHDKVTERAELSCASGSYLARSCDVILRKQINNIKLSLNASTNRTDNYREHNHYEQSQLLAKFAYAYASGRLYIDLNLAKENMQYPGALSAEQVRADRRQATSANDFFQDWSDYLHIRNVQTINDNLRLQVDLARKDMKGDGILSVPFTQTRTIYYLKPQLKATIKQMLWTNGLDLQHDTYHNANSLFGVADNKQQQVGAFSLANIRVATQTTFSLGVRGALQDSHLRSFTNSDNINRAFASTVGANYQYQPTLNFYLRRAESFRFPKADENSMTPVGINGLRTQRGVAYETGMQLNETQYATSVGIYQLNLKDEIAFDPTQTASEPFGSNRNLAPTVRRGFNLSARDQVTDKMALDGQFNAVNARFQSGTNSGNRIPLVAEMIWHTGFEYKFGENWSTYYEAVYTGNQYPANDDANVGGKMGGYTIFNFNLRYTWKDLSAALHVNNVFNREYYFYSVYQAGMLPNEFFYPAPERNIMLTLNYVFV